MQRSRWLLGVFACLLATFVLAQVPGTIPPVKMQPPVSGVVPPVKMRPAVPVKPVPAVTAAMEATEPFIEQYVFCNAMQLYQSRLGVWEPVYREAGASDAELTAHSANLVNYIKTFCTNGPRADWQSALDRIEAFDALTDRRIADAFGISLGNATSLRLSRLLANIQRFQQECLGGQENGALADLLTVAGSLLPSTLAPAGISLPHKDLATTYGKCGPKSNFGSSDNYAKLDQRSFGQCMNNALAQSATCDSPVASNHGPVVRQELRGTTASGDAEIDRSNERWRLYYRDGAYTDVTRLRVTMTDPYERHTTELRTEETYSASGELERREHLMSEDGHQVAYDEARATDMFESPPDRAFGTPSSRRERRIINAGDRLEWQVPDAFKFVDGVTHKDPAGWWLVTYELTPPSPSNECLGVNPGSASPLGLSRTVTSAASGGSPIRAGRLNTFDMIGQCLCTSLGRLGADLAARSGMRCGPDENTRRLDCLLNPRGPADGIRPECVGYLNADNPHRDTRTALNEWCGHVAQCPPGAGMATAPSTSDGLTMCSCGASLVSPAGRGAGGSPGASRCATVSCGGGPGMAGSDLYQQCCGTPGGGLPAGVDPSTGSPVPAPRGPPEMLKQPLPKVPMQPLPDKSKLPPPPK